jgi:hypothetical protein
VLVIYLLIKTPHTSLEMFANCTILGKNKHRVEYHWVPGHANIEENCCTLRVAEVEPSRSMVGVVPLSPGYFFFFFFVCIIISPVRGTLNTNISGFLLSPLPRVLPWSSVIVSVSHCVTSLPSNILRHSHQPSPCCLPALVPSQFTCSLAVISQRLRSTWLLGLLFALCTDRICITLLILIHISVSTMISNSGQQCHSINPPLP